MSETQTPTSQELIARIEALTQGDRLALDNIIARLGANVGRSLKTDRVQFAEAPYPIHSTIGGDSPHAQTLRQAWFIFGWMVGSGTLPPPNAENGDVLDRLALMVGVISDALRAIKKYEI